MAIATRGPDEEYCPDNPDGHAFTSRATGVQDIPWVEQCVFCDWIQQRALNAYAEAIRKHTLSERAENIAVATETQPFRFVQRTGKTLTMEEIVTQALGAASMLFSNDEKVFDGKRAQQIRTALLNEIARDKAEKDGTK